MQRVGEADHAHVVRVLPQRLSAAAAEQARETGLLVAHASAGVPATVQTRARLAPVLLNINACQILKHLYYLQKSLIGASKKNYTFSTISLDYLTLLIGTNVSYSQKSRVAPRPAETTSASYSDRALWLVRCAARTLQSSELDEGLKCAPIYE